MSNFYRVTLRRSTIGLPEIYRKHTKSLGLGRLQSVSVVPATPRYAGLILKLKELVQVENVIVPKGVTPKQALKNELSARKPFNGFQIVATQFQPKWD
jgi:ribosomal protein L30/L7E